MADEGLACRMKGTVPMWQHWLFHNNFYSLGTYTTHTFFMHNSEIHESMTFRFGFALIAN